MSLVTDLKKTKPGVDPHWNPGFDFSIVRSAKRRSISIEIRQAQVVIRAPVGVAEVLLLDFLRQKAQWVRQKIAEQRRFRASYRDLPRGQSSTSLVWTVSPSFSNHWANNLDCVDLPVPSPPSNAMKMP